LAPDHWSGCARTLYKDEAPWTESAAGRPRAGAGAVPARARRLSAQAQCPATPT